MGRTLATPMILILDVLEDVLDQDRWSHVRQDAVEVYVEWMLCRSLMRVAEQALSARELATLPDEAVQEVTLLLLRDMFRHNSAWILAGGEDRVDELFGTVAARAGLALPASPRFEIDDVCRDGWAVELCDRLGVADPVQVSRLFVWHAAITSGIRDGLQVRDGIARVSI